MRPTALTISYFIPSLDDRYMDSQIAHYDATNYVLSHPEIFKPSPYENYFVTKDGSVYYIRRKKVYKLTLSDRSKNRSGYRLLGIQINGKQKTITHHSLVARTYLGERHGRDINHKDENKLNNSVENLEYVTKAENMQKYFAKYGEKKPGYTGKKYKTKSTKFNVYFRYEDSDWMLAESFKTRKEAEEYYDDYIQFVDYMYIEEV